MKKLITSLLISIFILNLAQAQILVLQPDSNEGQDCFGQSLNPNKNFGNHEVIQATAWTIGGAPVFVRSFLNFDLSSLPNGAIIDSAKISLYQATMGNPTPGHSTVGGPNDAYIQRVTAKWDEQLLTWANQPSSTTTNQVTLVSSSSPKQDYLNIDVTNLYQDIWKNYSQNYGIVLKLATETPLRGMYFASSNNPDKTKHPKLVIYYSSPNSTSENQKQENDVQLYFAKSDNQIRLISNEQSSTFEKIQLFNLNGKLILEQRIDNKISFSLSTNALPTGLYIATVKQLGGKTKRFKLYIY